MELIARVLAAIQVAAFFGMGVPMLVYFCRVPIHRHRVPALAGFLLSSAVNLDAIYSGAHDGTWRLAGSLAFWTLSDIGLVIVLRKAILDAQGWRRKHDRRGVIS